MEPLRKKHRKLKEEINCRHWKAVEVRLRSESENKTSE